MLPNEPKSADEFTPDVKPVTPTESVPQAQPVISDQPAPVSEFQTAVAGVETISQNPIEQPAAAQANVAPITPPEGQAFPSVLSGDAIVVGGNYGASSYAVPTPGSNVSNQKNKKKLLLIVGTVLGVVLLGGGFVFGFYLPNQPENVWKTGINRTGKAISTLITDATEKTQLDKLKASELTGDLTIDSKETGKYGGTFSASADSNTGDVALKVTMPKTAGKSSEFEAKVMTELAPKAQYPDVYFQLTGLSALGLDSMIPGVSNYDGKWIVVSSDYLKQAIGSSATTPNNTDSSITAADVAEVTLVSTSTTNEYVFTTDTSKAVLVNKGFKGKETVDGVKAYRYLATIDKKHAKDYCQALGTNIAKTQAFKKLVAEKDRADRTKSVVDGCKSSVDRIKDGETFDMWIDGKYKLVHKVRLHDVTNKNSYADFGQNYKGDNNLNLFAKIHDDASNFDFNSTMVINFKDTTSTGKMDMVSAKKGSEFTANANFVLKASNKDLKITKPAVSTTIQEVLQKLGLDQALSGGAANINPATNNY